MKQNIFDKDSNDSIIRRVQKLNPDTTPFWGSMNATEMLLHCNRVNEQLLSAEPLRKGTSLKQHFIRLIALYMMPKLPKNARTPKRNITKGQIDKKAFGEQLEIFINLLHRFQVHNNPIQLPHPYFGDLSTQQWGRANYRHIDHHLRQFGV